MRLASTVRVVIRSASILHFSNGDVQEKRTGGCRYSRLTTHCGCEGPKVVARPAESVSGRSLRLMQDDIAWN